MRIVVLAENLDARAHKSSAQTRTPGNTPQAKARPTQDGQHTASKSVPTENPRCFHYLEIIDLQEMSKYLTTCVLLLYFCTSIDISTVAVEKTKNII